MTQVRDFQKKYKDDSENIPLSENEVLIDLRDWYINPNLVIEEMYNYPGEWVAQTSFAIYRYCGEMS